MSSNAFCIAHGVHSVGHPRPRVASLFCSRHIRSGTTRKQCVSHTRQVTVYCAHQRPHFTTHFTTALRGLQDIFQRALEKTKSLVADVRQASVAGLVLAGIVILGAFSVWIAGFKPTNTYLVNFEFQNAVGIHDGTIVRVRGVNAGRVVKIVPEQDAIVITAQMDNGNILIPRDSLIEANQSGLISETIIDVSPQSAVPAEVAALGARSRQCNSSLVVCHSDRVKAGIGTSYDEFVRVGTRVAKLLDTPEMWQDVQTLAQSAAKSASKLETVLEETVAVAQKAKAVLSAIDTDKLGSTLDNVHVTTQKLNKIVDEVHPFVMETLRQQ